MEQNYFDINKVASELIQKNIEKILKIAGKKLKLEIDKFKVDFDIIFKRYIKKSYQVFSQVKTILYNDKPEYLYDFFECNNLKLEQELIDVTNVYNLFDISQFSLIKGTGGAGKSILLKHFFLSCLDKKDLIPILIELKDIKTENSLKTAIFNSVKHLDLETSEEIFEYSLKSGCFLILLDGFDEVGDDEYQFVTREINNLCNKYENNYFIIASRPFDSFISLKKFMIFDSMPFTKEQAVNLIRKLKYDEEVKTKFVSALSTNLYERHKSFASNPLLLTIMLMTFKEYAEIPAKKHLFYSKAFDTLLTRHDATKGMYKRVLRSKLTEDVFKSIIAEFCFISYLSNKIEFTKVELENILKEIIKVKSLASTSGEIINDLCNCICLLIEEEGFYRFSHRSFQEYFTAIHLNSFGDSEQEKIILTLLDKRSHTFRGQDVLVMLYDMTESRFEKNVMIPILSKLEEKIDKSKDRYCELLKHLFSEIGFGVYIDEDDGDEYIGINLFALNDINYGNFLFDVAILKNDYDFEPVRIKSTVLSSEIIRNTIVKRKDELTLEEIIKHNDLVKIIKKSVIHVCIKYYYNCLSEMQDKYNKSLENILSIID